MNRRRRYALPEGEHFMKRPKLALCLVGILIALVYALPLAAAYARLGRPLLVTDDDECFYSLRVLDAYRGGTLGNPYLADHQDAPRYRQELVERILAWIARLSRVPPLTVLAASRIAAPVLIFLLLWALGRALGLEQPVALMAAAVAPLAPHLLVGFPFLRYFRTISPATHVPFLLVALLAVQAVWKSGSLRMAAAAGVALGILFYTTPPFYWSFAIGGTSLLALTAAKRERRALLAAIAIACVIAVPYLQNAIRLNSLPEVKETLARLDLMVPGRWPEPGAWPRFAIALVFLPWLLWWRRRIPRLAGFLLPFLVTGTGLLIQNVVTNQQADSQHWVSCLVPLWPLAGIGVLQQWPKLHRPVWTFAFLGLLLASSTAIQITGHARWEAAEHELPQLDARIPETLRWLNRQTPPGSVVWSDEDVMAQLCLFTHNRVYWTELAGHYVVADSEVQNRAATLVPKLDPDTAHFSYRVDYYLGLGEDCERPLSKPVLYRNAQERTCVVALPASARH
jgi:hypothetical protein